ncbi:MAG: 4-(cytidine 5'-diphospho)-2-C-methyl-D-erythritol kinase [Candidatus Binataceae bacterium]|nr:4-(cytidine 5'-diphospho)-2-C-methyl-D-erythritol kinase [Candidatus Binataceae bacterium]
MVKIVSELAPAKVNLYLRVTGRRIDGYHELDSLMVPLALYDQLALEVRSSKSPTVTIRCDHPEIPADDRNLAMRAARAFVEEFALAFDVSIDLRKRVPAGAGLGGGSSDAAAVLRAMASLFRIDSRERLSAMALQIGADVPFFIDPRPARITGIGERVAPIGNLPRIHLVIAVPPTEVATAKIFHALRPENWSGPVSEAEFQAIAIAGMAPGTLVNDLESAAIAYCPEIARLKSLLIEAGARASAMSGSGGAVFGIFPDPAGASAAAQYVRQQAQSAAVFAVSTIDKLAADRRL